MFRIPQKQLIINSASQLRILKYDGSATYIDIASPLLASDGFFLEGFLQPVLFGSLQAVVSTTLIKATAGAAGAAQVATFTTNAGLAGVDASSENFRIVYQSMKLSPVEYQNQPIEKHYQVSTTLGIAATANNTATAIKNAIAADKNSPVTATVGTNVVTMTAKEAGVTFTLYVTPAARGGAMTGTFAVTTPATLDVNTYEDLKSKNWSKGDHLGQYDVDRDAEAFPLFGTTYKSYRFILKSTPLMSTNLLIPSEKAVVNSVQTEFMLFIANGLTLQTTMDLVVADANTAA